MSTERDRCPCGRDASYRDCCGRLHSGLHPATTAEQLMRSRYSAAYYQLDDYLFASHHPSQRGTRLPNGDQPDRHKPPDWVHLRIVDTNRGGARDTEGHVEFVATYRHGQGLRQLHERSKFVARDGRWFYYDGDVEDRAVMLGRNDPCWCGAGKKFKKCHGRG